MRNNTRQKKIATVPNLKSRFSIDHRIESKGISLLVEKSIASFQYKSTPHEIFFQSAAILIILNFLAFVTYKEGLGIFLASFLSISSIAVSYSLAKRKQRIEYLILNEDHIKLPNLKSILKYEDIHSISEQQVQGNLQIRIERKLDPPIFISASYMDLKDFYDCIDIIQSKIPKTTTSSPYIMKRKSMVYGVLFGIPALVLGYLFFNPKLNLEGLENLILIPTVVGIVTYPLSKLISATHAYNKANREKLSSPTMKRRREIFNSIFISLFFFILFSALYFVFQSPRVQLSANVLMTCITISLLPYPILNCLIKLDTFVSLPEKIYTIGIFMIFGSACLIVAAPSFLKLFKTSEILEQSVLTFSHQDKNNQNCFKDNLSLLVQDNYCINKYPDIHENDFLEYKRIKTSLGIDVFDDFVVKNKRISNNTISKIFQKHTPDFSQCFKEAREKANFNSHGVLVLKISISPSGNVTSRSTSSKAVTPSTLTACVEKVAKKMSFPTFNDHGHIEVTQSFRFSPKKEK